MTPNWTGNDSGAGSFAMACRFVSVNHLSAFRQGFVRWVEVLLLPYPADDASSHQIISSELALLTAGSALS